MANNRVLEGDFDFVIIDSFIHLLRDNPGRAMAFFSDTPAKVQQNYLRGIVAFLDFIAVRLTPKQRRAVCDHLHGCYERQRERMERVNAALIMEEAEAELDRAPEVVRVLNPDGSQVYDENGSATFRKVRAN